MKIAILVSGFPPSDIGGTELQTFQIARRLAKNHEVTVLTRRRKGLPDSETKEGFKVRRFRTINLPVIRFISHVIFSLREAKRAEADVLQCMMMSPNGLVGTLAKKMYGIKTLSWVRGGDWYVGRKSRFGRAVIGFVCRNSDMVITQTERINKEILSEYPGTRTMVIHNGVDVSEERAYGHDIIFIGRLVKEKGIEYLMDAMKKIDGKHRLVLVGDGPIRGQLEGMSLGLNVKFMGEIPHREIKKHMRRSRVLVLPSLYEGLPNVILEAMSMGLPSVATGVGGIPDIIKDGKTGFVVKEKDSDELAKRISRVLKDDALRERMSRNCLNEVKKYSWNSVIKMIENAYTSLSDCTFPGVKRLAPRNMIGRNRLDESQKDFKYTI